MGLSMTKEELEKEAEDFAIKSYGNDAFTQANMPHMIEPVRLNLKIGYLAGAEPREKRIAELEEDNKALQTAYNLLKDNDEKIIKEMGEQIEKMKNCKNCANYMISGKCPCLFRTGWCKNWELTK